MAANIPNQGSTWGVGALLATAAIAVAVALGIIPLVWFALAYGGQFKLDAYIWNVLQFTLLQTFLSTALSVLPAIFVARALARQQFRGRGFLLAAFSVPLTLPAIVAVFGLAAIYGASGLFGGAFPFYGIGGIVLTHVFFNLPLATRILLEAMQQAPAENHRLAAQLNFSDSAMWRHVDWPVLRPVLPRLLALVALLCAGSFVIVLTLGGPAATTLEVAIFQSLRMDFDVSRAVTLSFLQIAFSGLLVWAAGSLALSPATQAPLRLGHYRLDGQSTASWLLDFSALAVAGLLVLPPLAGLIGTGIFHVNLNAALLTAFVTSLGVAAASACVCLLLAWPLALAQFRHPNWRGTFTVVTLAGLIVPPAVLATGWFLALRSVGGSVVQVALLIIALNSLMALPFAATVLAPALERSAAQHDRLCAHLGLQGIARLRLIDFPSNKSTVLQALLMAFTLSFGDLAAVTLLGNQGIITLPALLSQQMGNYRGADAGGTAVVLALMCFAASLLAQRESSRT